MKYYSRQQHSILLKLSQDGTYHVNIDDTVTASDFYFLERERLICRTSLKNRIITYELTPDGKAYLESYSVDDKRYEKSLRYSRIALILSFVAIVVSVCTALLG